MSLTELADQFDAVMMQQDSGNRLVDSVQNFFDSYLIATQTFTNNLAEAASKERARLEGMAKKDEMNSCWNAWSWFFKQMLTVCRANSAHIEDINLSVFKALGTYQKHMKATKPQTQKQIEGCMQLMRDESAKLKAKMEETRAVFEALQKVKPSKKKKLAVATMKAELAAEDYRETLRMANEKMDLLRAVKIPAILTQVESDEHLRVTSLAEAIQAFAISNRKKTDAYASLDKEVIEVSQSVHAAEDIRRYVTVCHSQRSATSIKNSVIPTFQYSLQTPPELRSHLLIERPLVEKSVDTPKKKAPPPPPEKEPTPKVSNIFGQTVIEVMNQQKRSHPHLNSLRVPIIVANIIKNLQRHGLNVEATFTTSPDPSRLQWLRDQFDSGNFSCDADPAVELGLLKCWLRELKEPLLPYALIDNCMRISRAEDEGKGSEVKHQVDQLLSQMAPENKEVLLMLVKLISEGASLEANKMGLHSLAGIFGPLIFREKPDGKADNRRMLSDDQAKIGRNLVVALVKNAPSAHSGEKSTSASASQSLDNLLARLHPEIIATENAYGDYLHLLNDKYVFSIQHSAAGLTSFDIEALCNNISSLFTTHAKFLTELTLTAPALIPALFLKYEQMFKFYMEYQSNYGACVSTLERVANDNKQFAVLIADTDAVFSKSKADLHSCLFMPLHRVTQYVLWFREIKKCMPGTHAEIGHVGAALAKLEEIAARVNENKSKTDIMSKMMAIQRSVRGLTVPLVSPRRTLVKDGTLNLRKDALLESTRVYLFSDYLMAASAVSSDCAGLVSLLGATAETKESLIIDEVVSDEIAPLIVQAIKFLRTSIKTEGIFRIEASKDDLQAVRQEFSKSQKITFDDVHVASNMLKIFFRELPAPIIPFELYKTFLTVEASRSVPEKINMYKTLIAGLPSRNKSTLAFLFHFLSDVVDHSAVNLMTPQSLGVVFAPNLLRQEVDTAHNLLHDNQVTVKVIVSLIENCTAIFGGTARDSSFEIADGKTSLIFQCTDEGERTIWLKAIQAQIDHCFAASKTAAEKLAADRSAAQLAIEREAELNRIRAARKLAEEQAMEQKKEQERLELEKIEREKELLERERQDEIEAERQRELMNRHSEQLEAEILKQIEEEEELAG